MYDVFTYLMFPTVFLYRRYLTATSTLKNDGGGFAVASFYSSPMEKRQKNCMQEPVGGTRGVLCGIRHVRREAPQCLQHPARSPWLLAR